MRSSQAGQARGGIGGTAAFWLGIDRPVEFFHRIDAAAMGFLGLRASALRLIAPGPVVHVTCTAVPASMRADSDEEVALRGRGADHESVAGCAGLERQAGGCEELPEMESTSRGGAAAV